MANIFTTAFVINGMLSNSFTSSTKMANSQLTELQQTVKRIDLAQKKLNAEFTNGAMSVEQYERKMGRYQDTLRFLYKGIIIKHNKTEPTYTKTSLFLCEKRRFFMARTEKGVVATI